MADDLERFIHRQEEEARLNWTIQVMDNKMVIVVAPQIQ